MKIIKALCLKIQSNLHVSSILIKKKSGKDLALINTGEIVRTLLLCQGNITGRVMPLSRSHKQIKPYYN